MTRPLTIDVVSDVVCPWCYIGKRRLDLARAGESGLEVNYRPYRLDPSLPPEGMERSAYMRAKFGDMRMPEIEARIADAGRAAGISFAFDRIERTPNTLDCHRLIRWAGEAGVQDAVVEDLFHRYFEDGIDVSSHDVLADIADRARMDSAMILDLLQTDDDKDIVEQEDALARRMGIEGVPCYIVGGRFALIGAQEPETLRRAFDRARHEGAVA